MSTDYISELVKETVEVVKTGDTIVYSFDIPEPLASQYEKPQKSHAGTRLDLALVNCSRTLHCVSNIILFIVYTKTWYTMI